MLSPLSKSEVKERDTAAHGQALKHREKRTLVDVPGTDSPLHSSPKDRGLSDHGVSTFTTLSSLGADRSSPADTHGRKAVN